MICSGYADRIHELMVIARELSAVHDQASIRNSASRNYSSEASHIEFAGVKVIEVYIPYFSFHMHHIQIV